MKQNNIIIHIADENLNYRDVSVTHTNPTGAQILAAAGISNQQSAVLLQVLPSGELESIRPTEIPDLAESLQFILSESDRAYFFTVDGDHFEWPNRHISGATIRKLAKVPEQFELEQLHDDGIPVVLEDIGMVDLAKPGVERIVTKQKIWKIRVQGVTLEFTVPVVKVAEAMIKAGFDPTKPWHIYLLVAGQPKQEVNTDYMVDLRTPGLEKIRLMQRNVDNGDGQQSKLQREFKLLAVDECYLDGAGLQWETILCGDRRWLVIHEYQLLSGYTPAVSKLALDIPKDYPAAQIDMFYFAPAVARCDGRPIPSTQVTANIGDIVYQGWSRHRNGANPWDPNTDNVVTHLVLVESCLAREFGE
ncbi:MAG: multiubiquitin domain-containing protein [Sideroxyarcus sp.]|nr:multiubiquitin domain-containing protein [Sideroxyarcus sp.]